MSVFFFDSSALVKRYVNEVGSNWVQGIADPKQPNKIYIATITGVEVISALMKKVRENKLALADAQQMVKDFRSDFQIQYELFRLTDAVTNRAMNLPEKHKLRAYDAVQLAAALIISEFSNQQGIPATGTPPLVLVASDDALLAAAQLEGLSTEDPRLHP